MSEDNSEARIVELVREAADARTQLTEDIEALAYKVSPENLKQEAIDATEQAARQAKAAMIRWGVRGVALARDYPLVVTATAAFGGLLYASVNRRSWRLMVGAIVCGAGALALGIRARRRRVQPHLTSGNALHPYNADWHTLPSVVPAPGLDATVNDLTAR